MQTIQVKRSMCPQKSRYLNSVIHLGTMHCHICWVAIEEEPPHMMVEEEQECIND
jgi:hypothetical protein